MPELNPSPFDDELLSAYLDDELTLQERARVDERLAADPAARQLFDELRSVSRAMKELPGAELGTDLRDSVLRRAERAMLVPGELAAASGEKFKPSFPIGRSKRAWFWAGAALAAGLMLMIFDRDPARDAGLPNVVAQRERDSNLVRSEPLSKLEFRPVESPADERVAATVLADGKAPLESSGQLTTETKETLSVSLGREAARPMQQAAAPAGEAARTALPRSEVGFRAKEIEAGKDLVVVHVNMKPEAMRGRAFDHLLLKNQIEIEEEAVDQSAARPETQDVEVVMVEAVPSQLLKCLDEIKQDETNYLGVAVDDRLANSQRALAEGRPETDMKQYNRGVVPNQQVERASDNVYYFKADQRQAESETLFRSDGGTGLSQAQMAQQPPMQTRNRYLAHDAATPAPVAAPTSSSGEANVFSSDVSGPSSDADAAGDLYAGTKLNVARRAFQQLKTKADTLQVLFVLTCPTEHAAPAAAGVSDAEPEEGLKSGE